MAQVELYPIRDVQLNLSTSSGNNGWSLINDAKNSPDDGSSYLYLEVRRSSNASGTSTFAVSESNISRKIYITGLSSVIRAKSGSNDLTSYITPSVSINGGAAKTGTRSSVTTSWTNINTTYTGVTGLNTKYDSFNAANIQLIFTVDGTNDGSKNTYQIQVTQAYVVATYLPYYNFTAVNAEGCSSVNVSASEVKEGDSVTFTATKPSNYIFLGWFSDAACTNKVSDSLSYTLQNVNNDTTLYAKAIPFYTVSVYGDEYCNVTATPSTGIQGTMVSVSASLTAEMRNFDGWYSNSQLTNLISTNNPYTFELKTDITLYARTLQKYEMSLKINGKWEKCSAVYKKINGIWVKQDDLSNLFDADKNYVQKTF